MSNTQLKGNSPGDPWLVIEGGPAEILDQLLQVFPDESVDPSDVTALPEVVAKARESWAARVGSGGSVDNLVAGLGPGTQVHQQPQVPQQAGPTSPAPSTPAPQAQAAPTQSVETDRWGNSYEHGHPKAPLTPLGQQAVLFRGTSQAGKPYARWIDPRSKKVPSVYASGVRQDPSDLWAGDFARGV